MINYSYRDLEYRKFRECPDASGEVVIATQICQNTGETVKVEFAVSGVPFNTYGESLNVAGFGTSTIINYTVPAGKKMVLGSISASGENRAVYTVEVNNSTQAKKRSYFTEYNVFFDAFKIELIAGDNLKVIVENRTNSVADFNANFTATLDDL
jgi:hypothetical protein